MKRHQTTGTMGGSRRQSGTPSRNGGNLNHGQQANGLQVRGVVVATYVTDGDNPYPSIDGAPIIADVTAVYCDVLCYTSMPASRAFPLQRVLVSQDGASMHEGRVWKPRAARLDMETGTLDPQTSDPRNLDGEHVLIGFIDNNLNMPIILRSITHPQTGRGNESLTEAGHRQKLKLVDGEPSFWKHRGSFFGVDDNGDFVVDTTRAHDGVYATDGTEVPVGGSVKVRVGSGEQLHVIGLDVSGANPLFELTLVNNALTLQLQDGATLSLTGKDGAAVALLGDGAIKAVREDLLNTLWGAFKLLYDAHLHPETALRAALGVAGADPTLVSLAPLAAGALVTASTSPSTPPAAAMPAWDADIGSNKLKFPAG